MKKLLITLILFSLISCEPKLETNPANEPYKMTVTDITPATYAFVKGDWVGCEKGWEKVLCSFTDTKMIWHNTFSASQPDTFYYKLIRNINVNYIEAEKTDHSKYISYSFEIFKDGSFKMLGASFCRK